ncbi:MAG: aromatic ring-hydroxylating oxygenase subunit alpha, partial [Aestuariivirgaceae bacterium]
MDNQDAFEALKRCLATADEAHSLPPAFYACADMLDIEARQIFHKGWVGIGRGDRWASPGDFAAIDVAGVPVIVVRGKDGVLNAFANSCRHRGARLLSGAGNCRGIKCPFHGWAYKLDGGLAGVPHMELAKNFDKRDYGLIAFHTAERAGFAFICLAGEAPDIDGWLGDFEALHAPWMLGELVSTRHREFEVACNWKPFLEVFNEYYHLPYVHP